VEGAVFTGIRDERDRTFPVWTDSEGRTVIANAVETCLIDHIPSLVQAGIGALLIDARGRGPLYAGEVTAIYRRAISLLSEGDGWDEDAIGPLKEELRHFSRGGITAGAFSREMARTGMKKHVI